jgi:hypothetical protein
LDQTFPRAYCENGGGNIEEFTCRPEREVVAEIMTTHGFGDEAIERRQSETRDRTS